MPDNYEAMVRLFKQKEEYYIYNWLLSEANLVHYAPGHLEFRPDVTAPSGISGKIGELLGQWTGQRWVVALSNKEGAEPLKVKMDEEAEKARAVAMQDGRLQQVLRAFPGASVQNIELPQDEHIDDHADMFDESCKQELKESMQTS